MTEESPPEAIIDFVPAVCFVPRGIAKTQPDKIVLTKAELFQIIQDTKAHLENRDDDEEHGPSQEMDVDDKESVNDEFNFNNYENEENAIVSNIGNIVDADEQLPDEAEDSETEDEVIKPTDNLLLVVHIQDDAASLEIWVFNQSEEALYTHHEFLLPSFPLCIEWFNHDPGSEKNGNMCAIGCMDPIITIWDLDIQDPIEPTFKLGSKGNRKKHKQPYGHKDAILDLSWSPQFEHILASGSVDQTVILWDIDVGQPHTTITTFSEKVQSIEFHPNEAHYTLTGCADGYVRLFDCRNASNVNSSFIDWKVINEVEKVLWHPTSTNYFIIGTVNGSLHYADRREPTKLLWSHKAHNEEISGLCFNNQMPNLLTTTSTEGILKVWNCDTSNISQVYAHKFNMGRLQCLKQCPEDPYTFAIGGEKPPRCSIYNIKNFEAVRRTFGIPDAE